MIEIPEPIPFPPLDEESETYYRILWRDYDSAGKSEVVCRTFHNAADGWSLLLPETVGRAGVAPACRNAR